MKEIYLEVASHSRRNCYFVFTDPLKLFSFYNISSMFMDRYGSSTDLITYTTAGEPPPEFGLYAGRQSRLKYKLHLKYFNGI
jgi:hypothetical protein